MPRGWVQPSAPTKSGGQSSQGKSLPPLTPRPQSTQQSRGAAVLRRGTFFSQLAGQQALQRHGPTLEQQQSLDILSRPNYHLGLARHDPVHATRVLQASNPGPVLQSVINQSPKLRRNQQALNDNLLKGQNTKKHTFTDTITGFEGGLLSSAKHSLEHPVNVQGAKDFWNQSKAVNALMANIFSGNKKPLSAKQQKTLKEAGILPQVHQGPISKIATDVAGTGIGVFPGLGYRVEKMLSSPKGLYQQPLDLAKQTVEAPYQFFRHPVRTYNQPGGSVQALMSLAAPLQLGAGAVARGAAVRDLAEYAKPSIATVRKPIRDVANSYVEEHGITPQDMVDTSLHWPGVSKELAHHTAETLHEIESLKGFHDFKDVTPVAVKDGEGNVHAVGAYARRPSAPNTIEALGLSSGTPGAGLQLIRHIANEARSKSEGISFGADPGAVAYYKKLGFHPIAEGSDMFMLSPKEVKAWADNLDAKPWVMKQYEKAGTPVTARNVLGAMWRPKPMKRELTYRGKTVSPPSYKSAAGGYWQKYALDRALQKGLDDPYNSITARMIRNLEGDGFLARAGGHMLTRPLRQVAPEVRFGRLLRKEQEMKVDIRAGRPTYMVSPSAGPTAPAAVFRHATFGKKDLEALRPSARLERMTAAQQKAMGPELAREAAGARAHAMTEQHHEFWNMSSPLTKEVTESPEWRNKQLLPVRDPKSVSENNFNPEKHMTEGQLAKRFASFFGQRKHAESQPWNYRYIPTDVVAGAHPYLTSVARKGDVGLSGLGKASTHTESFFHALDQVSQSVRVGRFFHPAYAQNAIQNRMFHLSQAGMFAFRNAHWYHTRFPQLSEATKGGMEEAAGGSRARALVGEHRNRVEGEPQGGELGPAQLHQDRPSMLERLRAQGEKFWHNVDDRPVRIQMLYHELNHEGYRTNAEIENLFGKYNRNDPEAVREVTRISRLARKEAVDYGEMTPAERNTMKRLFIAYGWTRGATTYSGRFGLQHPVQAAVAAQLGREGDTKAHEFFSHAGGMMPDWLEGIMPLSHGKSPLAVETSWASPFQTPADLLKSTGALKTSAATASEQFNPGPLALLEAATGRDQYGKALPGGLGKYGQIIHQQLISRIRPVGAVEGLVKKKPTGTIVGGPKTALERFTGAPIEQLRDIQKTAKGGLKTYRASLSPPERASFDHDWGINQIPREIQQMKHPPSGTMVGKYKGALAAKATMDTELYKYAKSKNYPSWRRLPATAKVQGAVKFMQSHYGMTKDEAKHFQVAATAMPDDTSLNSLVSAILAPATADQSMIGVWKELVKVGLGPQKEKVYSK